VTAPKVSDVIFRRGRKVRHMLRDMLALTLASTALMLATDDLENWFADMVAEATEPTS